ncbi:hypothetical protein [Bradyrhizobium sp.]|jgi:hypothetical protein|uniref:hypothetical protein n=1 Tax=Bradyrhizobium sp. TaxID=376 RepID=UPI003C67B07D
MKSAIAAAIAMSAVTSAAANAQGNVSPLQPCTARVVQSEELPFAPIDSWLVKVTLAITPHHGNTYYTTLHDRMPWQGPPPRRGQAFRLWCNPANPSDLRLAGRPGASSPF